MSDALNIKNLPTVGEIQPGDYLLVEIPTGSRILDFKNFIVTKDNISFAAELSGFNTDITNLLSRTSTLTSALFNGDQDFLANSLSAKTWLSAGNGLQIGAVQLSGAGDVAVITNHLSARGVVFASGGDSDQWSGAFFYTNANSGHWNHAYTQVNTFSANWNSVQTQVLGNSAGWHSVLGTVTGASGSWSNGSTPWYDQGAIVHLGSDGVAVTDKVGIGTLTPNEVLTVVGHISSSGNIFSSGGSTDQWTNTYTQMYAKSGAWESAANSGLVSAANAGATPNYIKSVDISDLYVVGGTVPEAAAKLTVVGNISAVSAIDLGGQLWERDNISDVKTTSGEWDDAAAAVILNTADISNVATTSGNWDSAHSSREEVAVVSGKWNTNWTTVNANSANWDDCIESVNPNSGDWFKGYTQAVANSADISEVALVSGNWDSAHESRSEIALASGGWDDGTKYLTGATWGTNDGKITFTMSDSTTHSVDIDGRYAYVVGAGLTTNYIPKQTAQGFADSLLIEISNKVGVNCSPQETFTVAGTLSTQETLSAGDRLGSNFIGGKLGIGTNEPVDKFEVVGGIHTSSHALDSKLKSAYFDYIETGGTGQNNMGRIGVIGPDTSTAGQFQIRGHSTDNSVNNVLFHGAADGKVGIGAIGPSYTLDVTGTLRTTTLRFGSESTTVDSILDEDSMTSNDVNALATQQSIKAYVDAQVTASDLDFQGDSGGALSIDLDTETLDIAGGTGIATVGADNTVTINLDAAQLGITSVYNDALAIGRDADNLIDFSTDDRIVFNTKGVHQIVLEDGVLRPNTDNSIDLGTSTIEFKDAFFDGTVTADAFAGPITGNVTGDVTGNAGTATALETPRSFTTTGDVVIASTAFDGSGNFTAAATIQTDAVEAAMVNDNVITGQTAETTVADDDLILIYDTSEGAFRKMQHQHFHSGLGAGTVEGTGTAGYIAEWSAASTITDSTLFSHGNNIGLGVTSTASLLHLLNADANNQKALFIDHNETGAHAAVKIDSQASEVALDIEGGGVHISQDVANTYGLKIQRNISEAGSNPLINFIDDNTSNTQTTLRVQQDGTGDIVNVFDGTTEVFTILNGGNVGIGENSPTAKVHVSDPALNATALTTSTRLDMGLKLSFSSPSNTEDHIFGGISMGGEGEEWCGMYAIDGGSGGHADLALFTGDASTVVEAIRILSDGKVGIGTKVPNEMLTVHGDISAGDTGDIHARGDFYLDDGGSIKEAGGTAAITIDGSGNITKLGQSTHTDDYVLTWDNSNSKAVWAATQDVGQANEYSFKYVNCEDPPTVNGDTWSVGGVVAADSTTDTLKIVAGDNITLHTETGDAAKAYIKISSNPPSYSAGALLDLSSAPFTFSVDLSELTDMSGTAMVAADQFVVLDNTQTGAAQQRKLKASEIPLSIFNNDLTDNNTTYDISWVDSSSDIILRLDPSTGSDDDIKIVAGSNITLTHTDANNFTIAGANTTYTAGNGLVLGSTEFKIADPATLDELTESTDDTSADGDKILLWDETASLWKYMTLDNLQDSIDTSIGITNDSEWDAKGDLVVGTGDNTATRLGVGGNDQILVADSSEPTGLKWVAGAAAGLWASSGSAVYYDAGNVGIGTTATAVPTHLLHLSAGGTDNAEAMIESRAATSYLKFKGSGDDQSYIENTGDQSRWVRASDYDSWYKMYDTGEAEIKFARDLWLKGHEDYDVEVGIISDSLTKDPVLRFSGSGISNSGRAKLYVDVDGGGEPFIIDRSGDANISVDNSGEVGIGTSQPNADLHLYKSSKPDFKIQSGTTSDASISIYDTTTHVGGLSSDVSEKKIRLNALADYTLSFGTNSNNDKVEIDASGNLQVDGSVTVGSNLIMGTNTNAYILVANGTSFIPKAMSGDVAISNTGATTIQADAIEHSMLNPNIISGLTDVTSTDSDFLLLWDSSETGVDKLKKVSADEFRATGMTGWDIAGDDDATTVSTGETVTIAGGNAISTVQTARTVTVNHDDTSSQASVDNSGRTYIQDVTLDTYGHVTGLTSATETVTDTTYTAGNGLVLDGTTFKMDDPANGTTVDEGSIVDGDRMSFWDENENEWRYVTIEDLQDRIDSSNDSAEANQDAWSIFKINEAIGSPAWGTSDVVAEAVTDTLNFVAGTNITLATDATNDAIRITATDTNTEYTAGDGLTLSTLEFKVDVSDFAGQGLEDDGSENLRIATGAAGNGLTGGGGNALAVGAGTLIDVAADAVSVDLSEAPEAGITLSTDYMLFLDGGVNGTAAKEKIQDFVAAIAGTNISESAGVLSSTNTTYAAGGLIDISGVSNQINVDLSEAATADVNVAVDYMMLLDGGTSGSAAKESIADFVTAIAGDNLTATNGVLDATNTVGVTVREQDGGPAVNNVTEIRVTNDTLTNDGNGIVSISTGDSGGGGVTGELFKTIKVNEQPGGTYGTDDVVADGSTDTLRIFGAGSITVTSKPGDDAIKITGTDTTYSSSDFTHDNLTGFVANEHLDWTTDRGSTNIHANNYTNTTYAEMRSSNNYAAGLVRAGSATHNNTYLRKDGTWGTPVNTTYTKASFDVDHLFTLVGAAADTDDHLGTFTGGTIGNNRTIKAALQDLETEVETKGPGTVGGSGGASYLAGWSSSSDIESIGSTHGHLRYNTNGLGIGTAPSYALHVKGNNSTGTVHIHSRGIIESEGDIIAFKSSDKRLKDNIIPISDSLDKIDKLSGVTFEWNDKAPDALHGVDYGVIAQEVEQVLPRAVTERPDTGYKAVAYEKLVPLLIEAVKELKSEVEDLRKQVKNK